MVVNVSHYKMKNNETGFVRYMKPAEFEQIIQWVFTRLEKTPPTQMAFLTQAYLGLRISETIALKRDNFNKDFSILTFTPLKSRTAKIHTRTIPKVLQALLTTYNIKWRRRYRNGYLFPPFRNQSKADHIKRSTIHHWFMRLRKELDMMDCYHTVPQTNFPNGKRLFRISSHTFRHHFAWKIYTASGKDIRAVQQILDHKDITTTSIYINALKSAHDNYEQSIVDKAFT